jgi:hypothetical protein
MRKLFNLTTLTVTLFLLGSCSKENVDRYNSKTSIDEADNMSKAGNNKGKGKGKGNNDGSSDDSDSDTGGDTISYAYTYVLKTYENKDPLHKFRISSTGDIMQLRTDSTITSWGEDFWGSWEDPFEYADNQVVIRSLFAITTYTFNTLSDGSVDVYKEKIVQLSYLDPNTLDTTYSHPGIYELE